MKSLTVRLEKLRNEKNYFSTIKKHEQLFKLVSSDKFWEQNPNALSISQEYNLTKSRLCEIETIQDKFAQTVELYRLAEQESDKDLLQDCELTLKTLDRDLEKQKLDYIKLMDGGKSSCYVEIVAGTGGLDAFDWTKMLALMYRNWGVSMGYQVQFIDESIEDYPSGGEGYRKVTLRIDGEKAFGHMVAEAGVHRLVRISPYDPKERRHTSFSQVRVYPVLDDENNSEDSINSRDIRIDTYRARGNGGQSVNSTDSAVRVTHIPSGIVVTCQNERSQLQNKATALKVLSAKIRQLEKEKKEEIRKNATLGLGDNSWGSQIRSVVLQPYTLVKDHRSGWETTNVEGLLEGKQILTDAIESYLLFAHSNEN